MNRTKTLVIALWAMFVGQISTAQKGSEDQLIQDATAYFEQGAYLKAFPLYSQLVSLYPNHAEYAFKFGACAIYGDADKTKAVRYLNSAISKSVNDPEVYYFLGKAYHLNYQFKDAITAYENYVRYAGEKAPRKAETLRQIETCIYGANLLSNIKDITVISKTETDKANFFRYFNLEAIGGKILTVPDALKSKEDLKSTTPGVIHYPGNGTTIYFSSYGKNASNGKDIYKAQVLPDGTFSEPEKLKGDVNTKYDEDFCFMHSDGRTLYFASKGHNSMGGYDIFKSVYDPTTGEFGTAVNLDFAINTPDDDIFYIADSLNQRAYFASGRSSDLDHLNVYNVMVETTPLQVVYLKGTFVSEIDPEQHKIGIKIIESNTTRSVCDGSSNSSNGEYVVYVPKSGQYTYKVVTENSPTVHEVSVKIPSFDKPVALRQEMRLINEGGKERIIINNYFDTPLDEDLSVLAAEMLRRKSVLDVNSSDAPMVSLTKTEVKKEDELRTFDQNMDNATVAAGFEGGSVSSITSEMKSELNVINRFVQESDTKRNNSLAYARKKQKETEAALAEAEAIRKALPTEITTEEEIGKLRRMVELTKQAEALQLEAQSAYNTAQA
ncbi:MAG: tetratricopeptide repeat protein, partial [Flavobacteriales bacterium]